MWAENNGIKLDYIQPGNPQQNAYIERYNRTVRYDWLAQLLFDSIEQVQESATRWLWTYNHDRPKRAVTISEIRKLHFWQLLKMGGLPNQPPNALTPNA